MQPTNQRMVPADAKCAARNNSIAATVDDVASEIRRMNMMATEDAKAIEQVLQSTGRDGAVDLAVKMHAFGVLPHPVAARELYCSSNGDRWFLVRDADRISVVHVPNASSGGRIEHFELGEFLATGGGGPEHQELLRLIGTLVEAP